MFREIENANDDELAFQPLGPAVDVDALRRQAAAKHKNTNLIPSLTPHAILSSSPPRDEDGDNNDGIGGKRKDTTGQDGEKKERKKIARMDEERLLSPNGFPALIKTTKGFVPKGKGHEVLLQITTDAARYTYTPFIWVGSGFEPVTPSVPVLDAQNVSQDSIQRYS
jgi:replication fork protection complex subunit Csm3/Swi3